MNRRAAIIGGTLAYESMHLAICLAMVSGHASGGQSSTILYHPLRAHHASFMAQLLRWLLTVDAAFVVHCLQSAARRDLILLPIRHATRVVRRPCHLIVNCLLIAAQVLSNIHQVAGHSLAGWGDYIKIQLLVLAHKLCMGSPGDLQRETTIPLLVLCHLLPLPPVQILATSVQSLEL